jgi:hypothetical protein
LVEADEDSDTEIGSDAGMGPEASGSAKPRHKTRAATTKQSISTAAAKVTAVKAAKKEKEEKDKSSADG